MSHTPELAISLGRQDGRSTLLMCAGTWDVEQLPSAARRYALVVETKEPNHVVDVVFRLDPAAHPARMREDMVRLDSTGCDQLIAHRLGKGKVGQTISVKVTQLYPTEPELD